ncbi:hypothetical protein CAUPRSCDRAFT_12760 [Caulochytrium protostelioides]|nr:hypothetical protein CAUPRSCDRAFT_12760 [Caulochytrium protostelioides]
MNQLILNYLHHHAYADTYAALSQLCGPPATTAATASTASTASGDATPASSSSAAAAAALQQEVMETRTRRDLMRSLIQDGDVATIKQRLGEAYPTVLPSNPWLAFQLDCQHFIEIVRQSDDEARGVAAASGSASAAAAGGSVNANAGLWQRIAGLGAAMMTKYGQHPKQQVLEALQQTYSLLAYASPRESELGFLLDPASRERVAAQVNRAILLSRSETATRPALERIYRQCATVTHVLQKEGSGAPVFLKLPDCLNR